MSALGAVCALLTLALASTGCNPTAEGTFEIYEPSIFSSGYTELGVEKPAPHHGSYLTRFEFIRQGGGTTLIEMTIKSFPITYMNWVSDTRCANLSGSLIRCIGKDDDGSHGSGPLRYVSLIDGRDIVGLQIWETKPSLREVEFDHVPESRGPRLMASFGQGANFIPR